MARRGRDLFELLRDRSGAGARASTKSVRGTSRPRAAKARGDRRGGLFARLGESARALVGSEPAAAKAAAAARPPVAPAVTAPGGLGVVAVVLAALLLGFLVGRWTASPVGPDRAELRRSAGNPGERPGALVSGLGTPAPALSAAAEEETLSNLGFFLLQCPARDRARAASAAAWFRDQGLERTRIRTVKSGDGEQWYLVICYTTAQDEAGDLRALRALDLPTQFDDPSGQGGLFGVATAIAAHGAAQNLTEVIKKH